MMTRQYPSPFQIQGYYMPVVVISEPNQIKTILQHRYCLNKGRLYKFAEPILGMGITTVSDSVWLEHRKIIAPSFNLNILRKFFYTFVKHSFILANKLEKVGSNGNEIILHKHLTSNNMDTVCAMMGIELETNIRNKLIENIERFKDILRYRIHSSLVNLFMNFDIIFKFTTLGREQQKIIKSVQSLVNKQLQQLNKLHSTETEPNKINKTIYRSGKLMEIFRKNNVTKKLIRDNVNTLIIAASDSISITLNFVFFMLANFPEIQDKVYKELLEIYGTKTPMSAPVKYEDLQHMHYADRVIKETMRLFPAYPIISRRLSKDIKIGDYILPKNTDIAIALMQMYRNEKYWSNPLKFDPDRFLPERIKDCHSYYYIPFSDGPRNCIGPKYAMISMKVILATLIRTFAFKVDKSVEINKIKLRTDILLSTVEPLKVRIEKREL
ncbi:PREDICTED: cytochrome P450 4C1-like [Wasmannia auropunctata]|uniref:cytochrome P450 4C1-like n=1 Tax=Wasmannia auropunctata TaxID=64793 RepID=UPI0005EF6915|nr:PREDICTED: cytochrome P450 4C1-like [Wasmannia auropunctata]